MNLLGYLITLANIKQSDNAGAIKDLSVEVAEVQNLYSELLAIPGLNIAKFRETGYFRYHNNVGKYLSKNLREYMFEGLGNPDDEGVVVTLVFDDADESIVNGDDTLSVFLHRDIANEDREEVQNYMDGRFGRETMSVDS